MLPGPASPQLQVESGSPSDDNIDPALRNLDLNNATAIPTPIKKSSLSTPVSGRAKVSAAVEKAKASIKPVAKKRSLEERPSKNSKGSEQ